MNKRVYKEKVDIDEQAIKKFFSNRAKNYNPAEPLVAILYQDSNPELAVERDVFEKNAIIPLLNLKNTDKVLDVGCGIGRWAESLIDKVGYYHGTDLDESLVEIAKEQFKMNDNVSFQPLTAQEVSIKNLVVEPPFDVVIVAGVMQYINDQDSDDILKELASCCGENARMYFRVTIGIEERLTLNQVWSEELKQEYSSIYRTLDEYIDMFNRSLVPLGFEIQLSQSLYPANLNNRKETQQHIFILTN